MNQIAHFARQVLPRLQAHEIEGMPAVEQLSTTPAIA